VRGLIRPGPTGVRPGPAGVRAALPAGVRVAVVAATLAAVLAGCTHRPGPAATSPAASTPAASAPGGSGPSPSGAASPAAPASPTPASPTPAGPTPAGPTPSSRVPVASTPAGPGPYATLPAAEAYAQTQPGAPFSFPGVSGWQPATPLQVLHATPSQSAGYGGDYYFFFVNGRLVGKQSFTQALSSTATGPAAYQVSFAVYKPGDPVCCPSGGQGSVTFGWNGSALVVSGSLAGATIS
jgi:hypothetical protein